MGRELGAWAESWERRAESYGREWKAGAGGGEQRARESGEQRAREKRGGIEDRGMIAIRSEGTLIDPRLLTFTQRGGS